MHAIEAIRKPVITIPPDATVADAAARMDEAVVGCLVVTDDDQHPVGIVTDRDLAVRALARRMPVDGRVDSVATTDVVTFPSDGDLHDAIAVFRNHPFRRLPLVDADGKVSGMLTVDDLVIDITGELVDITRAVTGQVIFGHPEAKVPATG